jgi:hypothetical protein
VGIRIPHIHRPGCFIPVPGGLIFSCPLSLPGFSGQAGLSVVILPGQNLGGREAFIKSNRFLHPDEEITGPGIIGRKGKIISEILTGIQKISGSS